MAETVPVWIILVTVLIMLTCIMYGCVIFTVQFFAEDDKEDSLMQKQKVDV